jgi:hypothetical protein
MAMAMVVRMLLTRKKRVTHIGMSGPGMGRRRRASTWLIVAAGGLAS